MSRIFDALRRFEQEKSGQPLGMPPVEERRRRSPVPPAEAPLPLPEQVAHLQVRAGLENHVVAHLGGQEAGAEKFRVLRHKLQQLRQQRPLKKILITSAIPQEGKTLISINLATTLALSSTRVLLIDGDLRSQSVHHVLGLEPLPGLAEVLAGEAEFLKALHCTDPLGVYYLPAGHTSRNPVELFQAKQMTELIAQAARLFEWIVLDSPPLNPFADAHCLATVADGVLLVQRMGLTPRPALQQAMESLAGVRVLGALLNGCNESQPEEYYSYYYGGRSSGRERSKFAVMLRNLADRAFNHKVAKKWLEYFTHTFRNGR